MLGELNPCGGGDLIPLLKPSLLIGRRSSCDVCLRFPNVSSHHCKLEWKNGYWHVSDLKSTNGIKVNGKRCKNKWLMPGDVLSVAKHSFELNYTTAATAPPPDQQQEEDVLAVGLLEKAGLAKSEPRRKTDAGDSAEKAKAASNMNQTIADFDYDEVITEMDRMDGLE